MIEFTLSEVDIQMLDRKLKKVSPVDRSGVLKRGFEEATMAVERRLKLLLSGHILHARSGHLRSSAGSIVTEHSGNLLGTVGSGARTGKRMGYATIHETGGVIRPRRTKFLAVPTRHALTASGVSRGGPRKFKNTFVARTKFGGLMIFQRKGSKKNGRIIPLFKLVKKVVIPARKYMTVTVEQMRWQFVNIITTKISKILEAKS